MRHPSVVNYDAIYSLPLTERIDAFKEAVPKRDDYLNAKEWLDACIKEACAGNNYAYAVCLVAHGHFTTDTNSDHYKYAVKVLADSDW